MCISKSCLYQRKLIAEYDDPDDPEYVSYSCYKTRIKDATIEVERSVSESVSVDADEIPLSDDVGNTSLSGEAIGIGNEDSRTIITYDGTDGVLNIGAGLAVDGNSEPIGTTKTVSGGTDYSTDVSTAADTGKTIATLPVLGAGTWVIAARARFTPSASGTHMSYVTLSTSSASTGSLDGRCGTGSNFNQHNFTTVVNISEDTRYYLCGHANAAGSWKRGSNAELRIVMARIV